jgi:hypothetical protein
MRSGMYDERFKYGISYMDVAHRETIQRHGVKLVPADELLTAHIDHPRGKAHDYKRSQNGVIFKQYYGKVNELIEVIHVD